MNGSTRLLSMLMLAGVAGVLGGCAGGPGPLRSADFDDARSLRQSARHYWMNHNVAFWNGEVRRKAAVAEFNIEFVTERLEPVADGTTFVRRITDYGEGLKMELPGVLYYLLQTRSHLDLTPMDQVNEAAAYAKLTGTSMGQKLPPYRFVVVGSDLGRPKEGCLYTTYGLRAIDPRQHDVEAVLAELLKEVKADVVLRFRLRVGVYQGRATLERGSVIDVTTATGFGDVESISSMISGDLVVDEMPQQHPSQPQVYHVNAAKFRKAIGEMAVPYLKMAAMATR